MTEFLLFVFRVASKGFQRLSDLSIPKTSLSVMAIIAAAFGFLAQKSQAYEPVFHGFVEPHYDTLENCGQRARYNEVAFWNIDGAKDLGSDFVEQEFYSNFEFGLIIYQCAQSSAIVLGSGPIDPFDGEVRVQEGQLNALVSAFRMALSVNHPQSLDEIQAFANLHGVSHTGLLSLSSTVAYDDVAQYHLNCACQLYYPDSPGASQ